MRACPRVYPTLKEPEGRGLKSTALGQHSQSPSSVRKEIPASIGKYVQSPQQREAHRPHLFLTPRAEFWRDCPTPTQRTKAHPLPTAPPLTHAEQESRA